MIRKFYVPKETIKDKYSDLRYCSTVPDRKNGNEKTIVYVATNRYNTVLVKEKTKMNRRKLRHCVQLEVLRARLISLLLSTNLLYPICKEKYEIGGALVNHEIKIP